MRTFDARYENMSRPELEQLQLERLQTLLVRLKRNVRRQRERLGELRVESLADLARLPFTTPAEVLESFPYGMLAFPLREVIRLNSTVGSGGKPMVAGHTRNDLLQWGRLVARQLVATGVTANDVLMICLGGGEQAAAAGYVLGAELIEASVIAEEPFHIDHQLAMLKNYRPTILITTPTNANDLILLMDRCKVEPQSLGLRSVLLTRPVGKPVREQIGAGLFATVQCNFGIGEVLDPGLCVECAAGRFHVNEDHFLVEADAGELVVTTLCREAMPLLRYRTRVTCEISSEKCPCGRTSRQVMPGVRLDGRVYVNEMPIYEQQVGEVLAQSGVAGCAFRCEFQERRILIHVQMTEQLFADVIWPIERLRRQVEVEILNRLGVEAQVSFMQDKPAPHPV
ncbi:MAG: hypothetical protein WCO56_04475 [Verrucomicrobiota bacterium]